MRKIKTNASNMINTVFVLVLFCVFAVAVLMVLLAGTGAYQDIADRMERQYAERTCLSYLDAKVRHYDETGKVAAEQFGDCDALALYEDIDGVSYKTLIYCYEGYVRELFIEDGMELLPEHGETIVPAQKMTVETMTDSLVRLVCTSESGNQEELVIYLRSEKGADVYA